VGLFDAAAVAAAGAAAGAANSIAGGGSLITFSTLVALGLPQLSANVTNTVGLIPGAVSGTLGYADTLGGQRRRILEVAIPTVAGAVLGTILLLVTPNDTFEVIVPGLVAACCLLLLFQPRLVVIMTHAGNEHSPLLAGGLVAAGAYGAYFGAAVSILLLALLTLFVAEGVQRLNGIKILLAGLTNLVAAFAYVFLAPVRWPYAVVMMAATLVGGISGARLARRVSGDALRVGIACVGLVVAGVLAVRVLA
jgi:uncharacterized protein